MATMQEIVQKSRELEVSSKDVDWEQVSGKETSQFLVKCSDLSQHLNFLCMIEQTQKSFFRYTLLVTAAVLGALLLKVNGTYVAFVTCVIAAVWTAALSLVVAARKSLIKEYLEQLTLFVKKQPTLENDLGEKE